MPYAIRGKIGALASTEGRIGQLTYLAETGDHFYIWDGAHKAAHFESPEAGLDAAKRCKGPWFNAPDPSTIEAVESHLVIEPLNQALPGGLRACGDQ